MTYYNFNDCRPEGEQTIPADEWRWQTGDRWVATVGETDGSWWGEEDPVSFGAPEIHTYPIDQVPATGTLVYWLADGSEVEHYHPAPQSFGAIAHETLPTRVWDALVAAGNRALADEVADAVAPDWLAERVQEALVSDRKDVKHDALRAVAAHFGVDA